MAELRQIPHDPDLESGELYLLADDGDGPVGRRATLKDIYRYLDSQDAPRIWWCETHSSTVSESKPNNYTLCLWMRHENNWDAIPAPDECRFVERLLVSIGESP